MTKIITICTGNTCRSPLAQGVIDSILKKHSRDDVVVHSAGVCATNDRVISENSILALAEIGIDLSAQRSALITRDALLQADIIYAMTTEHKIFLTGILPEIAEKIFVLNIPDPFGKNLDAYRECRDKMIEYFNNEYEKW
ncbi:MAG: low molecular weight protein arginine phosphatase [Oscillospiraceae bacterium]